MAYDALRTALPSPVVLYNVYLTAEVDTLLARMQMRNRDAERTESEEAKATRRSYLERLQERHDEFFGLDAGTLGVEKYIGTRINSELPADQVSQSAEFCIGRIAPSYANAVSAAKRGRVGLAER